MWHRRENETNIKLRQHEWWEEALICYPLKVIMINNIAIYALDHILDEFKDDVILIILNNFIDILTGT